MEAYEGFPIKGLSMLRDARAALLKKNEGVIEVCAHARMKKPGRIFIRPGLEARVRR